MQEKAMIFIFLPNLVLPVGVNSDQPNAFFSSNRVMSAEILFVLKDATGNIRATRNILVITYLTQKSPKSFRVKTSY